MAKLPSGRAGQQLVIKQRPIRFSLWSVRRTTRRYGLQSHIFVTNPWHAIRHAIKERCDAESKDAALIFVDHAEDYFKAASSGVVGSVKPVLFYYSFLNIAKAFCLFRDIRSDYSKAKHGLSEVLPSGGLEITDAYLDAFPSGVGNVNVFGDFHQAITKTTLSSPTRYPIPHLLPQILQGHRLWCLSCDSEERFYNAEVISLQHGAKTKDVWLDILIPKSELARNGMSFGDLLAGSRLAGTFRTVKIPKQRNREYVKYQMKSPVVYSHRPSDVIQDVVNVVKPHLWVNVLSIPPYKRYYLYVAPSAETANVMHQVLSIYALFYYLGSVTRYRPKNFQTMIDGVHGAQIQEMLANIPSQFLYLMASEFTEQDIVRAAIV